MVLNKEQIQYMKEGGAMLAGMLRELVKEAKPGVATRKFEELARELIQKNGVKPSFLGFGGYPAVICTSINEEAVHAVPSERILKEGDLLTLDFGIVHKGLHTDSAVTVLVTKSGAIGKALNRSYAKKLKLMSVTKEALDAGISAAKAGNTLGDIGFAIQNAVEGYGMAIVRELGGHGIGTELHEAPWIGNFGNPGEGPELVEGMALALEPIVSLGGWKIKDGNDGHAYETEDGSLTAHFEHTLIITKDSPLVVTK